jgi:hypothetical protein
MHKGRCASPAIERCDLIQVTFEQGQVVQMLPWFGATWIRGDRLFQRFARLCRGAPKHVVVMHPGLTQDVPRIAVVRVVTYDRQCSLLGNRRITLIVRPDGSQDQSLPLR